MNRKLFVTLGVVAQMALCAGIAKVSYDMGEKRGVEEGRYAMRQHIDNVRWVKTFNMMADSYDQYAADIQKKIAAGEPVADKDRAAVLKEPKIDRQKTFGKVMLMAKESAGQDPTEASWLKINGFSD